MKENESLIIAQEMDRSQDFIHKGVYFKNAFENNPVLKDDPQPPLVSYQVLLAWKIFGENIWSPRLINVVFGVSSILVIYLIGVCLFSNIYLSLFCALLLAIIPLGVFFSRNLQSESPAFFFMLLGNLFYLKYFASLKKYNLLLAGVAIFVSWLYKFNFIIGALPIVLCLPFKTIWKDKNEFLKFMVFLLLPYSLILITIALLKWLGQWANNYNLRLFEIFTFTYWMNHAGAIAWYSRGENFTSIYCLLAACGVMLAFFKRKSLLDRYILGWMTGVVVYMLIFSEDIYQNNYAQMPFLGFVCISCAYAVSFISQELKKVFNTAVLLYVMITVVVISIPSIKSAISRMHGTVFLGQDVAGETLKEFTAPDERVFLFTHAQGYAISRYASRYVGWPADLEDFKKKEKKFGVKFVCIYPGEYLELLKKDNPKLFEYIQESYRIKELGLLDSRDKLAYLILEKGKTKGKSLEDSLLSVSGRIETRSIYRVLGRLVFFYTIRPENRK